MRVDRQCIIRHATNETRLDWSFHSQMIMVVVCNSGLLQL